MPHRVPCNVRTHQRSDTTVRARQRLASVEDRPSHRRDESGARNGRTQAQTMRPATPQRTAEALAGAIAWAGDQLVDVVAIERRDECLVQELDRLAGDSVRLLFVRFDRLPTGDAAGYAGRLG